MLWTVGHLLGFAVGTGLPGSGLQTQGGVVVMLGVVVVVVLVVVVVVVLVVVVVVGSLG